MSRKGTTSQESKSVTLSQVSWSVIALTFLVGLYVYRDELYLKLSGLATVMDRSLTVGLLAISVAALIVLLVRQKLSTSKVVREVENRDKQINFHKDRTEEVLKSEQRYKTLFEEAVKAATLDLEKLNVDLQEKQTKLAEEIAGHKKTDTALRESEQRWMKLVEKNPEAIVITVQGIIAYANPAGRKILGVERLEELRGTRLDRFLPDGLIEEIAEQISSTQGSDLSDPIEFEIQGLDSVQRTVEMHAVPAVFRGKQASQNVFRDVTARKRNEEEIRSYTDRLHAMVEIERMLLLSASVNDIAQETLGQIDKLVGIDFGLIVEFNQLTGRVRVIASQGIVDTKTALETSPMGKRQWDWATKLTSSDSALSSSQLAFDTWLRNLNANSYLCIPLAAGDDTLGAIVVASSREPDWVDTVSSTVHEFADLLALGINQDRIIEERRNYELEILSAKEHAEELVKLKSVFLTNMSHEIRTPLTSIIGFAQILSEEIGSEHVEFLKLIEESGKRLLSTINSVLDLARLESNSVDYQAEELDVAATINDSVTLLQSLSIKRGIQLSSEGTGKPMIVEADKSALDRILNNLIGNAIKFTEKGGVVVRLSKSETEFSIEVVDTGVGISEQFMPDIFDDFKQESNGPSRSYEGSGMGLSITRKLVDAMSGRIEVSSRKGKGSTFRVILPIQPEKSATTILQRRLGTVIADVSSQLRPPRQPIKAQIPAIGSAPAIPKKESTGSKR